MLLPSHPPLYGDANNICSQLWQLESSHLLTTRFARAVLILLSYLVFGLPLSKRFNKKKSVYISSSSNLINK